MSGPEDAWHDEREESRTEQRRAWPMVTDARGDEADWSDWTEVER